MAVTTHKAPPSSETPLKPTGRKRTLQVSAAELDGIRNILNNPTPPSAEMQAGWQDYLRYAAENPDSNW